MMQRTIRFGAYLSVGLALCTGSAFAQGPAVPTMGFHNVHMRVPEPAKASEWYIKYLGATKGAQPQLIYFGKTLVEFLRTDTPKPSAGSVVDHIGLSFPDLAAKMKEFESGGVKIVAPVRDVAGLFKFGFIEDPWGTKIEVVEDAELLGFHHVHLRVPDSAGTLKWYQDTFGGERSRLKGRIDGLRYGSVWLLADSSGAEKPVPTADRAIYNIAFEVADINAAVATLKAKGLQVPVEPRSIGRLMYAFVDDPVGVRIELIDNTP
jgi:catechol 2,3-dioxygenase-like lactoylglutathione lyase family enzyme